MGWFLHPWGVVEKAKTFMQSLGVRMGRIFVQNPGSKEFSLIRPSEKTGAIRIDFASTTFGGGPSHGTTRVRPLWHDAKPNRSHYRGVGAAVAPSAD
jgi:hypothetical protein